MAEYSRHIRRRTAHRAAVLVALLLLLAGCAENSGQANSEHDRESGFYGGVTSGGAGVP